MNKKVASVITATIFTAVITTSIFANKKYAQSFDLTLANIEALANNEGDGTGSYDVLEDKTDHFMNGELYKQSKVVNCHTGGSKACSSGKYYRLKKSDGSWDKWIPA